MESDNNLLRKNLSEKEKEKVDTYVSHLLKQKELKESIEKIKQSELQEVLEKNNVERNRVQREINYQNILLVQERTKLSASVKEFVSLQQKYWRQNEKK